MDKLFEFLRVEDLALCIIPNSFGNRIRSYITYMGHVLSINNIEYNNDGEEEVFVYEYGEGITIDESIIDMINKYSNQKMSVGMGSDYPRHEVRFPHKEDILGQ